jgi:hypothetical protein
MAVARRQPAQRQQPPLSGLQRHPGRLHPRTVGQAVKGHFAVRHRHRSATGIRPDGFVAGRRRRNRDAQGFSEASLNERSTYFGVALCRMKAVTISFCANAMALLAVVIWAPASTSGNCIVGYSTRITRKFCRSKGHAQRKQAPQKQTLPVLAGSVVLRGSDAASLTPGGTQMDEREE